MKDEKKKTYKIIRFYEDINKPNICIKRGLTLEEAQAHCNDPKTSSNCELPDGLNWFDGYTVEE